MLIYEHILVTLAAMAALWKIKKKFKNPTTARLSKSFYR